MPTDLPTFPHLPRSNPSPSRPGRLTPPVRFLTCSHFTCLRRPCCCCTRETVRLQGFFARKPASSLNSNLCLRTNLCCLTFPAISLTGFPFPLISPVVHRFSPTSASISSAFSQCCFLVSSFPFQASASRPNLNPSLNRNLPACLPTVPACMSACYLRSEQQFCGMISWSLLLRKGFKHDVAQACQSQRRQKICEREDT